MPNEMSINRLLYAMLSQKCLKDICMILPTTGPFRHSHVHLHNKIDWNKVAQDPFLAQEITNGHAARMRYSRFKKQMEETTFSPPPQPRTDTIRRGRVKKIKTPKREYRKRPKDLVSKDLPIRLKTESGPSTPPPRSSPSASGLRTPPPTLERIKTEQLEEWEFCPASGVSSSRLSTPLLMFADSEFSPTSPSFPTPGVVSLNRSPDISSSNRKITDQSIAPSQLHLPEEKHREIYSGLPSEFCMHGWEIIQDRIEEDRNVDGDEDMIFVKSEEEEYAFGGIFI
ncbi:hypothetical protein CJF32_00000512 [Rutstroemia sp. NJR-2017a WRK4]|nr:hypothetical protein CJF32_00000512 [Rutstroemia sp. NJR-2017a WRK4]